MESQAVKPALGVLEGLIDVLPGECLVVSRVAVRGQTGVNEGPLLFGEEGRRVRVVLNKPVRGYGNDDSGETLLV